MNRLGEERRNERQITQRSGEVTLCKILNTSNMSLQVCGCCGWSKHTTYQGLRIHQGKMGCTPKGMRIPESQQYRFNSYTRNLTFNGPPIKVEEPLWNIFGSSLNPDRELNIWRNEREESRQKESAPVPWITPVRKENVPVSPNFTSQITPTEATAMFTFLLASQQHSVQTPATNSNNALLALDFTSAAQPSLTPVSQISTQASPAPTEVTVKETHKSLLASQQHSVQTLASNSNNTLPALDFTSAAQPSLMPVSQISSQASPAPTEVTVKETQKSLFETPEHSSTTYQTATNARRALDFTSNVQVGQLPWDLPTTTAQETAVPPKEREKEKKRERERERREREAQKLQKARQDKIKADLQQKIQTREQKLAEVTSSVKACKGDLDAEWLEINSVFSEVMRVVEDARQKALQPLEERRQRVKREAQEVVKKLRKEIDKLKKAIDELDQNPDSQVCPVSGPNEPRDWKNVTVDTSFSFGSLRTTTSNMIKLIQQKMEKLSSVELKRIPTFAVDVKLDATSAHQCLVLSEDGKTVRDGGKSQKGPDDPRRFDMHSSILGLNRLTSGRSYWEVEVSNKTGWDLGVARRDANRKGKLSLKPDNGYWVTVHYEDDKYAALTAPPVSLSLTAKPQKVGVFVDYEEGLVSFYDVTARSHIYSFTECSFDDVICPYFSPHLKQNEKNSHPLVISAVNKQ
ncbi:uncharacterized protein LOC125883366 [Epinephelus fuscoguttatus]|uniref:uncharacterized protein LOC125883366 n=1 Tax=Epinephelus fuscoguttatus TaxID=293821 RepID=UPI0020D13E12|nr:uncharacterized protein LOC125883366 [Epinephelus fuscoguttatus]